MNRRNILSAIALSFLTISAVFAWELGAPNEGVVAAQAQAVEREFIVEGMHCASCPVTVRVAAERVKGVKKARVSMKQGRAWVTFDSAITSAEAIAAAITKAGYPARPVGANPGT